MLCSNMLGHAQKPVSAPERDTWAGAMIGRGMPSSSPSAPPAQRRLLHLVVLIACLAPAVLVIGLHLRLLPGGSWGDEYITFGEYRLHGAAALWDRFLHWAPRPFSEALIWLYWCAVRMSGRPLLTPALSAAWLLGFLPWVAAVQPWRCPARASRAALAVGLPACALLAGAVANLFYWPFAALAYLPALGLAAAATILVVGPGVEATGRRVTLAGALTLGALSVEVGAFLAAAAAPLLAIADMRLNQDRPSSGRILLLALVPASAASLVLVMLAAGRGVTGIGTPQNAQYIHHVWPSLWAALPLFITQTAAPYGGKLARSLLANIAIVAGAHFCIARAWPARPARGPVVAMLAALATTSFLSIATAFYQLGSLCCERHDSYRHALTLLMLVCAAGLLPRRKSTGPAFPSLSGPVALALALFLIPGLPHRWRAYEVEERMAPLRASNRAANFAAGRVPGDAPMRFILTPNGPLIYGDRVAPGTYAVADHPPWWVLGRMLFFGKGRLIAVEAKQPPK